MAQYRQEKQKISSKLRLQSAEEYLEDYFHVDSTRRKEMETMKSFCTEMQGDERKFLRQFLFKIVQYEISHSIIGASLQTLPEYLQTYVRLKYRDHKDIAELSQAARYSTAQLNKLKNGYLSRIWHNLHYRLTRDDIYFRNVIVNMKESLATFMEIWQEIEWDEDEFSDECYFQGMSCCYDNCCCLLDHLDDCILHPEKSIENRIVATVVANPFETRENIANICNCKNNFVTYALNTYERTVEKYFYT